MALGLDAKFHNPNDARAMIGPGVSALVSFLFWSLTWSMLRMWRQEDREFYDQLHTDGPHRPAMRSGDGRSWWRK